MPSLFYVLLRYEKIVCVKARTSCQYPLCMDLAASHLAKCSKCSAALLTGKSRTLFRPVHNGDIYTNHSLGMLILGTTAKIDGSNLHPWTLADPPDQTLI